MTGATGFIGRHLARRLLIGGHQVAALSRDPARAARRLPRPVSLFGWDARSAPPPAEALQGLDAVIHLAGESVAERRWNGEQKRRIAESRVLSTQLLMRGLRESAQPGPRVVIASSAVGYYGDRADEVLNEEANAGSDFLARLCVDWEAALAEGAPAGARAVSLRTGVVLGEDGGALPRLSRLFRLGLGGPLAGGRQWMSWIHIDDLTALFELALTHEHLRGPVNATAPEPARNLDFTRELARAVKRPALFPVPAFALRIALGEFAGSLSGGQRALPAKAQAAGFAFRFPTARRALEELCAGTAAGLTRFESEQWLPRPPEALFPYFTDAANLEELTPPALRFKVLGVSNAGAGEARIGAGATIDYRLRIRGIPVRWRTLIESIEPPRRFSDVQARGPYAFWRHEHRFDPAAGGTLARDVVRYRLPFGPLGALIAGRIVRAELRRIFSYRRGQLALRFGGDARDAEGWMTDT